MKCNRCFRQQGSPQRKASRHPQHLHLFRLLSADPDPPTTYDPVHVHTHTLTDPLCINRFPKTLTHITDHTKAHAHTHTHTRTRTQGRLINWQSEITLKDYSFRRWKSGGTQLHLWPSPRIKPRGPALLELPVLLPTPTLSWPWPPPPSPAALGSPQKALGETPGSLEEG